MIRSSGRLLRENWRGRRKSPNQSRTHPVSLLQKLSLAVIVSQKSHGNLNCHWQPFKVTFRPLILVGGLKNLYIILMGGFSFAKKGAQTRHVVD